MPAASRASTEARHLPGGSHANDAGEVQLGLHSPSLMARDLPTPGTGVVEEDEDETEAAARAPAPGRRGEEEAEFFAADDNVVVAAAVEAATASAAVQSLIIPAGEPAGRAPRAPFPSGTSSSLHLKETAEASSAPKEMVAAEGRNDEDDEGVEEEAGKLPPSPLCRHQRAGGVASTSNSLEAAEVSPWALTLKTCLPSSRALNEAGEEQGFQEVVDFLPSSPPETRAHSNDPAPPPPPAAVPNSNSTSRLATTPSGPLRTVATTTSQRPPPEDAAAAAWAVAKGLCAEASTPENSPSAASA